MANKKIKYYDIRHLLREYPNAQYYIAIGERSNGKTYSAIEYALDNYIEKGEQAAYIRRFGEDIRPKRIQDLLAGHIQNKAIQKRTNGQWNAVRYQNNRFYFELISPDGGDKFVSDEPFMFCFDLASMEHYKSTSYPKITTIIFDEFLSRQGYLTNEYLLFTNSISTIVRLRDNVKIFMLGNTVNRYCPYFAEMGLTHIKDQKQGTVDCYHYGSSNLEVVVEYCPQMDVKGGKPSDVYFAFDNPELQMITKGAWEIGVYPHLEERYRKCDKVQDFFIQFEEDILHGEIVCTDKNYFIFIHPKTTPIKDTDTDIVYTSSPSQKWNYKMALTKQRDKLSATIMSLFNQNRVFYSDNETGEIVRNYLKWSDAYNIKA